MEQVELMRHHRHHLNQRIPLKVLRVNLVRVRIQHQNNNSQQQIHRINFPSIQLVEQH